MCHMQCGWPEGCAQRSGLFVYLFSVGLITVYLNKGKSGFFKWHVCFNGIVHKTKEAGRNLFNFGLFIFYFWNEKKKESKLIMASTACKEQLHTTVTWIMFSLSLWLLKTIWFFFHEFEVVWQCLTLFSFISWYLALFFDYLPNQKETEMAVQKYLQCIIIT